jgi:hypothetical protein
MAHLAIKHTPAPAALHAAEEELKSVKCLNPLNLAYRLLLQYMTKEEADNNYSLAYIKLCAEKNP